MLNWSDLPFSRIIIKIVIGLVITSFLFASIGNYLISINRNVVVKVDDVKITFPDLEKRYQNELDTMRSELGQRFYKTLSDLDYLKSFRKSILERMVNRVLLEKYSKSLGLQVTDSQLRELILSMPQFQYDGKFDIEFYKSSLFRSGFSVENFEQSLRIDYLIQNQLIPAIQESNFLLPGEINAQNKLINQIRNVRIIEIGMEKFLNNISLSEEEIFQYYSENAEFYSQPEKLKLSYIELSLESLKKNVVVTDDEAKQYYFDNINLFFAEESRKISHIFIPDNNQEIAYSILEELNLGANFSNIAKKTPKESSTFNVEWIQRNTIDPEIERAVFSLKSIGDISSLIQSKTGYHIIRLDDVKASFTKPYSKVSDQVKEELKSQKAINTFYELKHQLENLAFEFPYSLNEVAQSINQPVYTTDFISENKYPEILKKPIVLEVISKPEIKQEGLNSEVIEINPEHILVIRVEDFKNKVPLLLDQVSDQIIMKLSEIQAKQKASIFAKKLVDSLKNTDEDVILEKESLKFSEVKKVNRTSEFANTIFSMKKPVHQNSVYTYAQDATGNVVIIALDSVENTFNTKSNQTIVNQLIEFNSVQELYTLLHILRSNTNIKYFDEHYS
ncbi:SurA N-terminal domain-containing protein [Candidatus Photodesmus anomalopis]|uniref:Periplasmic chaperone PpiD n=1 Tax=Candidatus Photodesmus katoptron Akat1 TaxID=1236703 RepID=S3DGN9_9GAMM|nr:SurA N-terminal domain-containing protein [Candidatus Photodesmus katoptron]EPE37632.1 parvulin-like peptidyl-prolyl isomerase [Candidatus Photodesmus katoptron Akat1]